MFCEHSDSRMYNVYVDSGIGAGLMLSKTIVIVVGLQLLSYSARQGSRRAVQCKVAGFTLAMIIGPLTEICAYAFAPQSMLAPLNGFDVVWNICLAPFTLGESVSRMRLLGTLLVFLGSTVSPIFGPHLERTETLEDLRLTFLSIRFLEYAAVCIVFLIAGAATLYRRRPSEGGTDTVRGILLAVGGGAIAGQNYFLSSAATLVHTSLASGEWTAWCDWLPYFVISGAIACAVGNAVLMNKALAQYEAMLVVPMFAGSAITLACVSAAAVLLETASLAAWRLAGYWLSIVLVICGLAVLSHDASMRSKDDLDQDTRSSKALGDSSSCNKDVEKGDFCVEIGCSLDNNAEITDLKLQS